jgi:hypothetical protein
MKNDFYIEKVIKNEFYIIIREQFVHFLEAVID